MTNRKLKTDNEPKSNWMLYPQGRVRARPFFIKKIDGAYRYLYASVGVNQSPQSYQTCLWFSSRYTKQMRKNVLNIQKTMDEMGTSMSFRCDRDGGYWISHILTDRSLHRRFDADRTDGTIRSIEDLMETGWEITNTILPSKENGFRFIYQGLGGKQGVDRLPSDHVLVTAMKEDEKMAAAGVGG